MLEMRNASNLSIIYITYKDINEILSSSFYLFMFTSLAYGFPTVTPLVPYTEVSRMAKRFLAFRCVYYPYAVATKANRFITHLRVVKLYKL